MRVANSLSNGSADESRILIHRILTLDSVRDGNRLPGAVYTYRTRATRLPSASPHSPRVTGPYSPRVYRWRWLVLLSRQLDTLQILHLRSSSDLRAPRRNNIITCASRVLEVLLQPGWLASRRAVYKKRLSSSLMEASPLMAPCVSASPVRRSLFLPSPSADDHES